MGFEQNLLLHRSDSGRQQANTRHCEKRQIKRFACFEEGWNVILPCTRPERPLKVGCASSVRVSYRWEIIPISSVERYGAGGLHSVLIDKRPIWGGFAEPWILNSLVVQLFKSSLQAPKACKRKKWLDVAKDRQLSMAAFSTFQTYLCFDIWTHDEGFWRGNALVNGQCNWHTASSMLRGFNVETAKWPQTKRLAYCEVHHTSSEPGLPGLTIALNRSTSWNVLQRSSLSLTVFTVQLHPFGLFDPRQLAFNDLFVRHWLLKTSIKVTVLTRQCCFHGAMTLKNHAVLFSSTWTAWSWLWTSEKPMVNEWKAVLLNYSFTW